MTEILIITKKGVKLTEAEKQKLMLLVENKSTIHPIIVRKSSRIDVFAVSLPIINIWTEELNLNCPSCHTRNYVIDIVGVDTIDHKKYLFTNYMEWCPSCGYFRYPRKEYTEEQFDNAD